MEAITFLIINHSNGNLTWNTFLGSGADDDFFSIAVDTEINPNIYVSGSSGATWGTPVRPYTSGTDGCVAKLNSSGSLIWHTFLGGSGTDYGSGIAIDSTKILTQRALASFINLLIVLHVLMYC